MVSAGRASGSAGPGGAARSGGGGPRHVISIPGKRWPPAGAPPTSTSGARRNGERRGHGGSHAPAATRRTPTAPLAPLGRWSATRRSPQSGSRRPESGRKPRPSNIAAGSTTIADARRRDRAGRSCASRCSATRVRRRSRCGCGAARSRGSHPPSSSTRQGGREEQDPLVASSGDRAFSVASRPRRVWGRCRTSGGGADRA
jgi:hypothetical protein